MNPVQFLIKNPGGARGLLGAAGTPAIGTCDVCGMSRAHRASLRAPRVSCMHAKTSRAVSHLPSGRAPTASGSHESMPSWELEPENLECFKNSRDFERRHFGIAERHFGIAERHFCDSRGVFPDTSLMHSRTIMKSVLH